MGGKLSRSGEGGKSSVSVRFFHTFPFPRTPGGSTLSSAFHREQASRMQPALAWPVTQALSMAADEMFEYRADRKLRGRTIDYGTEVRTGLQGKLKHRGSPRAKQ